MSFNRPTVTGQAQLLFRSTLDAAASQTLLPMYDFVRVTADSCTIKLAPTGSGAVRPAEQTDEVTFLADGVNGTIIDGNGTLIDGAATLALGIGASATLILQSGQWRQISNNGGSSPGGLTYVSKNYYIDPISGNDAANGTTSLTPFKHWSAVQEEFGWDTEIIPITGADIITVTYLGVPSTHSPLETAPVTLNNTLAPGCTLLVQGQTEVLKSGALTAAQTTTRDTCLPGTVTAAGLGAAHVGKEIQITAGTGAGSRAMIICDLGGGQVQVSEWCTGTDTTGTATIGIVYGTPPVAGDTYHIVDFTQLYLGPCSVGFDYSRVVLSSALSFAGGMSFVNFRFAIGSTPFITELPFTKTADVLVDFADCIFENPSTGGAPCNQYNFANCVWNIAAGGQALFLSGSTAFWYFGGLCDLNVISSAGSIFLDGDFVLARGGSAPVPNVTQGPLLILNGYCNMGPTSFWNLDYGVIIGNNALLESGLATTLGEFDYIQLYGDNNAFPPGFESNARWQIWGGPNGSSGSYIIPTLKCPNAVTFPSTPALPANLGWFFNQAFTTGDIGERSMCFDSSVSGYSSLFLNTYARLLVAVGSGGFETSTITADDGSGNSLVIANAQRPDAFGSNPGVFYIGTLAHF